MLAKGALRMIGRFLILFVVGISILNILLSSINVQSSSDSGEVINP